MLIDFINCCRVATDRWCKDGRTTYTTSDVTVNNIADSAHS